MGHTCAWGRPAEFCNDRALTNLIGNGVATIVISRCEGELDVKKLNETMAHSITVGEELEATPV